jgi:hypothetical protein
MIQWLDWEGVPAAMCHDKQGHRRGFIFGASGWREDDEYNDFYLADHAYLLSEPDFRRLFPDADVDVMKKTALLMAGLISEARDPCARLIGPGLLGRRTRRS